MPTPAAWRWCGAGEVASTHVRSYRLRRNGSGGGDREGDGGDQPVARPEDGGHQRVLRQRRDEACGGGGE